MSSSGGSDDKGALGMEASSTQASHRSGRFLRSQRGISIDDPGIGTNDSGSPDNESGSDQSAGNPSQGGLSIQDIHTQKFNWESERTALEDKPQLDEEEDMEAILSAMDPKTMETQVCFDFLLGKCPNRTCNRLHCTQKDAQSWLYIAKQSKDPSKEGQIKALEEILTKVKSSPQPRA